MLPDGRLYERLKQLLLCRRSCCHKLRMPLYGEAEGMVIHLQCFCMSLRTVRRDP